MVSTVQSSNWVRMVPWMRSSVSRSMAAVASSKTRTRLLRSRARARHTSCLWPTLRREGRGFQLGAQAAFQHTLLLPYVCLNSSAARDWLSAFPGSATALQEQRQGFIQERGAWRARPRDKHRCESPEVDVFRSPLPAFPTGPLCNYCHSVFLLDLVSHSYFGKNKFGISLPRYLRTSHSCHPAKL